jgi:inhibitor of cysteine peptidase
MLKNRLGAMVLISSLILVVIPMTVGAEPYKKIINETDNGKTISVKTGDVLDVRLPTTAGTGYSWHLDLSDGLHLIDTNNYASDSIKYGGSRIQEFVIKAAATGIQKVKGIYKRSWEKETGNESIFMVNINVV